MYTGRGTRIVPPLLYNKGANQSTLTCTTMQEIDFFLQSIYGQVLAQQIDNRHVLIFRRDGLTCRTRTAARLISSKKKKGRIFLLIKGWASVFRSRHCLKFISFNPELRISVPQKNAPSLYP